MRRHRRPAPISCRVALLGLAVMWGCGDSAVTALDITPAADPVITDVAALLSILETVEVIVDHPDGLYPGREPGRLDSVDIRDLDNDGMLELTAQIPAAGLDQLPLIRLNRGGLPATGLELRLHGFTREDPSEPFAAGGQRGITFAEGLINAVEVKFNTRPSHRSPRVTGTTPSAEAPVPARQGQSVMVHFDSRMDADSLRRAISVSQFVGARTWKAVEPAAPIEVLTFSSEPDAPTVAIFPLGTPLDLGRYRIAVSTAATNETGRPLDQRADEPGEQPFSVELTVEGGIPLPPCPPICPSTDCQPACPHGAECRDQRCWPEQCPACDDGLTCHPVWNVCVTDCRLFGDYGGCPTDRPLCDADGLCQTE